MAARAILPISISKRITLTSSFLFPDWYKKSTDNLEENINVLLIIDVILKSML